MMTSGNKLILLTLSLVLLFTSAFATATCSANYLFNKDMNIAINDSNFPDANTTFINFQVDTASLITAGKMRSDCRDLDILKKDTNTLLDRDILGCNTNTTTVRFKSQYVQKTLDQNNIMCYDYAAKPTDQNVLGNVYQIFQNFDVNSLTAYPAFTFGDPTKWSIQSVAGNNVLRFESFGSNNDYLGVMTLGVANSNFILDINVGNANGVGGCVRGAFVGEFFSANTVSMAFASSGNTPTPGTYGTITDNGSLLITHDTGWSFTNSAFRIDFNNNSRVALDNNGVQIAPDVTTTNGLSNLGKLQVYGSDGSGGAGCDVYFDNIKLARTVSSQPTITLSNENQPTKTFNLTNLTQANVQTSTDFNSILSVVDSVTSNPVTDANVYIDINGSGNQVMTYNSTLTDFIKLISGYSQAGVYNYTFSVDHNGYSNATLPGTINIDANRPVIDFTTNPTTFDANQDINFTLTDTNNIVSDINFINWSFPDGNNNGKSYSVIHQLTNAGNNQVCVTVQTISVSHYSSTVCHTYFARNVKIVIRDENTLSIISSGTATLNGNAIDINSDGKLNITASSLVTGPNTITVSTPTKSQRSWIVYSDTNTNFDLNFMLLDTNKGTAVTFLMKDTNGNTYDDANFVVMLKKPIGSGSTGDYNVSSGTTDSTGLVSIFVNTNPSNDGNYLFIINKSGMNRLQYDDSNITISVPLDEAALFTLTPYQVTEGGLTGGITNGLTASVNFRILSNTVPVYTFTIDRNSDYYDRTYSVTTNGGADLNLQPYLAKVSSSSIIAFSIKQLSLPTLPIPDVVVQLKKTINGTLTTLESQQSDVSGTVRFSMINADSYILNFYYLGNQICTFPTSNPCNATVNTTFTQYNVLIDVNGTMDVNQTQLSIFVTYTPTATSITSCLTCQVSLSQDIQSYYAKVITVTVTKSDGTLISSITRNYTHSFTEDIFNESFDSNTISSIQWVTVNVIVKGQNDENQTSSATYTINQTNSFLLNLRNMRNDVGDVPLLILSIVITILITGSMGIFFRDSGLTVMMAAIIMAFFTFGLGWVNPIGFFLACMSAFGAYLWYERLGV